MRNWVLGLACGLVSCAWPSGSPKVVVENNPSIVFPRFFERSPVEVGGDGGVYELDGVMLRALMVAANHRFPPDAPEQPCLRRREAHQYRVIRRGDIVFVRIDQNLEFCGMDYIISLDSGVTYAISLDGRILRRVLDGDPMELEHLSPVSPTAVESHDGGMGDAGPAEPEVLPSEPDAGSHGAL